MTTTYDVIVLGVGGMGSAACAHLAKRGVRVLGLEQFALGHDRGSSHGETRIIRLAYFEHPDYVPLLRRAYALWDELEADVGQRLLHKTRLLLAGPPHGEIIQGTLRAAEQHHLSLERLTPVEASRRYQGIVVPADLAVVIEPDGGYLRAEDCTAAHQAVARRHGAVLLEHTPVRQLSWSPNEVMVVTDQGRYLAAKLVITAGAWTSRLLTQLAVPLVVSRKFLGWFDVPQGAYHVDDGSPCFFFEMPTGAFYGFPSLDGRTLKVANHFGAEPIEDPSDIDRGCRATDVAPLVEFLRTVFPQAHPTLARHAVCMYTLSPDQHFILDHRPESSAVTLACGFSGHGYKFASVIGEILADLSLDGQTRHPIDFLRLSRFGSGTPPS
jgi:sarcosine oxidase